MALCTSQSLLKVRKRSLATESMDHTDDEALNLTPDTDDINVQTNVKSDTDQSEAVGSDFKNRVKKKSWKNCLQKYVLDFNFSDKVRIVYHNLIQLRTDTRNKYHNN